MEHVEENIHKKIKWPYLLIGIGAAGLTVGGALLGAAKRFQRAATGLKNPRFVIHATSPDGKKTAVVVETQSIGDYRYDLWVVHTDDKRHEHYRCLGIESFTEPTYVEWSQDSNVVTVHTPGLSPQTVDLEKNVPTPARMRPPWVS